MSEWLEKAAAARSVSKKRKKEPNIQTLNEQIQERRQYLSVELPRQLPDLERELLSINTKLLQRFTNEQVNEFRSLCEEQGKLLQRVQDIQSGRLLRQFEDYVAQVHQTVETAAPQINTRSFMPTSVSNATAVALASVMADEEGERSRSTTRQEPDDVDIQLLASRSKRKMDSSEGPGPLQKRRRIMLVPEHVNSAAISIPTIPSVSDISTNDGDRTKDAKDVRSLISFSNSLSKPTRVDSFVDFFESRPSEKQRDPSLRNGKDVDVLKSNDVTTIRAQWMGETDQMIGISDDDLLDEGNDLFDSVAIQKTRDCQKSDRTDKALSTTEVAAAHSKHDVSLLRAPEDLEKRFLETALSIQQSTHVFNPICTSADKLKQMTFSAVRRNERQFADHDNLRLRELNESIESLIDWSLIAPRPAEKDICSVCRKPLVHAEDEAILSCEECGRCRPYLDTTSTSVAFNSKISISSFIYVRNTHFDAVLAHFEPEAYVDIPESVYDVIRREAYMHGTMSEISVLKIKDILKKHDLSQYYGNIVQIHSHLNNRLPPVLSEQQKTTLRTLFTKIRDPFEKFKGTRKNFLSYSLVFVKLCELLGYTEFVGFFDLLKSGKKLAVQMDVWERICKELGWPFYRSH